jgi:hypothetical protein
MSHSYNIRDHNGNRLVHEKANVNDINIHYCLGGPADGPAVMLGKVAWKMANSVSVSKLVH